MFDPHGHGDHLEKQPTPVRLRLRPDLRRSEEGRRDPARKERPENREKAAGTDRYIQREARVVRRHLARREGPGERLVQPPLSGGLLHCGNEFLQKSIEPDFGF